MLLRSVCPVVNQRRGGPSFHPNVRMCSEVWWKTSSFHRNPAIWFFRKQSPEECSPTASQTAGHIGQLWAPHTGSLAFLPGGHNYDLPQHLHHTAGGDTAAWATALPRHSGPHCLVQPEASLTLQARSFLTRLSSQLPFPSYCLSALLWNPTHLQAHNFWLDHPVLHLLLTVANPDCQGTWHCFSILQLIWKCL